MERVTVNLAPPTVRKVGSGLDLAIAIALLVASGQVDQHAADGRAFLGELGLDGRLRPVPGTICLTEALGDGALVLPPASAYEARLVGGRTIHPVRSLGHLAACLRVDEPCPYPASAVPPPPPPVIASPDQYS